MDEATTTSPTADESKQDTGKPDEGGFGPDTGGPPIEAEVLKRLGATDDEVAEVTGDKPAKRKYLGKYDKVEDLEEHGRHWQSEADKAKNRADALEREVTTLHGSEEWAITQALKADPAKRDKIRAIIAGESEEDLVPPDVFDPTEVKDDNSPTAKYLRSLIRREAKSLVRTEIEPTVSQIRQQQEAAALLAEYPELGEAEAREKFAGFVHEKMRTVAGLPLRDHYRLFLAETGAVGGQQGRPREAPRIPRGTGGAPSREPVLTPEQREALAILSVENNIGRF